MSRRSRSDAQILCFIRFPDKRCRTTEEFVAIEESLKAKLVQMGFEVSDVTIKPKTAFIMPERS